MIVIQTIVNGFFKLEKQNTEEPCIINLNFSDVVRAFIFFRFSFASLQ